MTYMMDGMFSYWINYLGEIWMSGILIALILYGRSYFLLYVHSFIIIII